MNSHECKRKGCTNLSVGRRLCRKHYQQAWKRGQLNNDPLPPRARDRKICPAEHKHASSTTCYIQHQCRCDACMDHHAAVARSRSKLKAYGRFDTGLVDVEPVREHMMLLAEFGLGYKRVAMLAGIGVTPVRNIIWGRQDPGPRYGELQKRIKRETAEAVLAVKPDLSLLAGGVRIPARGVHRRIQALVARGWSQSKLSEMLGVDRGNFWGMMQRGEVSVRFHREVAEMYERLWNVGPPRAEWRDKIAYSRAIRHAKDRRWLPPLAWDDIDNDVEPPVPDEDDGPDQVAVQLAISGDVVRLSRAERHLAVARLVEQGIGSHAIAERLHMHERQVDRDRADAGIAPVLGADGRRVTA
jgi:hypothetical protein